MPGDDISTLPPPLPELHDAPQTAQGITIEIKCSTYSPPAQLTASADPRVFSVLPSTTTVGQLKQLVESRWEGKPRMSGQRMIRGGRVLRDEESFEDLLKGVSLMSPCGEQS